MKNPIPKSVSVYKNQLPKTPGVYIFYDSHGKILYIGKAGNLKRRVESYFARPHDKRIQRLVSEIRSINYQKTDTATEALILESDLINKHQPPFNVREKDDKSFLYVEITKDEFPRVTLARGHDLPARLAKARTKRAGRQITHGLNYFGPFTSATSIRETLKIMRKIFPWNVHLKDKVGKFSRPCLNYEIGLCPGTCIGEISKTEYAKNIRNIKLFFKGQKRQIIKILKNEMALASKNLEFEKAEKSKRQIFALQHIQDIAAIEESKVAGTEKKKRYRIEGYDVSNISGTSAVGSMVVFLNDTPSKKDYRKFRIKTIVGANDTGMMHEIISRRLKNSWPLPNLILVDGGKGQVSAAKRALRSHRLEIPIVGVAKGQARKRNDIYGVLPKNVSKATLIHVRDEAHRFAIQYHKQLRARKIAS